MDKDYALLKDKEIPLALACLAGVLTIYATGLGAGHNFKLAREVVELALKLDSHHPRAYYVLGLTYYFENNKDEALRCCNKAKEIYDKLVATAENELSLHERAAISCCGIDEILQFRERILNEKGVSS